MSLGRNARLRQFLDMIDRGEVDRARAGAKTVEEWARRLGMTRDQLRGVQRSAKAIGLTVPQWGDPTAWDSQPQPITDGGLRPDADDKESCMTRYPALGVMDDSLDSEFDFSEEEPTLDDGSRAAYRETDTSIEKPIPLPAIPQGHRVRGASTLIGPDGDIKGQWIKTTAVNDERADWLEAVREFTADLPRFEPIAFESRSDENLLTVYPVGDPHIGLLAWHEDAGENFDMDIAERNIVSAFAHLTSLAPASKQALLIFIGDNGHADSQANTTTKGTRVDADGRTVKMQRRIVRTIRRSVDLALAKHEHVRLIIERGNHDELLSAMVALALSLLYENEPRVSVDTSPEMYHWFRFGQNLIGTHHGDKAKPMDLLGVMAVDRVLDWAETKHRRMYCGHLHHLITKEVPGVVVEYLPTLATSDAWHRAKGYRSQRAMYMDVFDREHGHVNRHYVGIEQVVKRAG